MKNERPTCWSIDVTSSTCGTYPNGMRQPWASTNVAAFGLSAAHSANSVVSSAACGARSAGVAKRGSSSRSIRPVYAHSSSHCVWVSTLTPR